MMSRVQSIKQNIKNNKAYEIWVNNYKFLIIVMVPLLLCPLPIAIRTQPAFCAFILILMIVYWITECLPMSVTALLPVALFPLFGIAKSKCVSQIYFSDTQMLFLGALVVAICIKNTGLHEKLALRIMMLFGSNPVWILLGIMVTTGFLSLWIQNGAATSMMMPIAVALVNQMTKYSDIYSSPNGSNQVALEQIQENSESIKINENRDPENQSPNDQAPTKAATKLLKCFVLSVAYASSIGGIGTLVGTTSNLVLKGFFDENYPQIGLNFITYMAFTLPLTVIMLFFSWIIMCLIWLPPREWLGVFKRDNNKQKESKNEKKAVKELDPLQKIVRERYAKAGPYTWEQISIAVIFLLLIVLWITRDLFFVPGWSYLFGGEKYVTDTTPSIFMIIVVFAWPKKNIFKGEKYEPLFTWAAFKEFPWNVTFLSAGSLAIAYGFQVKQIIKVGIRSLIFDSVKKSGLSTFTGQILTGIMPTEKIWALLLILVFNSVGTEFTSNASMASIFMPIADSIARNSGVNPVYYLMPLNVAVSLSFMLPIATSPNAFVYGSGHLKVTDMMISGLALKVIGLIVVFAAANIWLLPIYPINPSISQVLNNATIIGAKCEC